MVFDHQAQSGELHKNLKQLVRGHAAIEAAILEHAAKHRAELAARREAVSGAELARRTAGTGS